MSRARELSRLGNINVLSGDDINSEVGIASTVPRSTLDVRGELQVGTGIQVGPAGVITATSFDGALGGNIVAAACTFTTGTFTGNVTIGGTLTYEDVTNVDALGIVTARAGVNVSGGQIQVGVAYSVGAAGVCTAAGFVGPLTGAVSGTTGTFSQKTTANATLEATEGLNVTAGVSTFAGDVYIKNTFPRLYLLDTDSNSDFSVINSNGSFMIYDDSNSASRFTINSSGVGAFNSDLEVAGSQYITDSIIHTGDTNTKIRFPSADTVTVETGGSERLRVASDGKVGINQTPTRELSIHSPDNNNSQIHFTNDDTGETASDGIVIGLDGNEDLIVNNQESSKNIRVFNGGSERLRITSAGAVGVGTDSPNFGSFGSNTSGIEISDVNTNNGLLVQSGTNEFYFANTSSSNYIWGEASAAIEIATNSTVRLKITSGGDVEFSGTAAGVASCTWDQSANSLIFKDNSKAVFGDGSDLQVYHDGSNSFISDEGTGILRVRGSEVRLSNPSNSTYFTGTSGGSAKIYHNDVVKIETTNDGAVISGIATVTHGLNTAGLLSEEFNTLAGQMKDNPNIDLQDGMIWYFTTQETATATPNIRYNASKTLNNMMSTGDAITVTIITTAGSNGYSANWQIDGSNITEEWIGGEAPSEGGSDGYDIYTANILKTGNAAFKVFINLVNAT